MKRWALLCIMALASPVHAVRFKIYDLGAIGTRSTAQSVNDWGMVVGNLNSSRCFVWTEALGMFKPGPWFNGVVVNNFTMYSVNNQGQATCSIPWYINGELRDTQPAIWTFGQGYKVIPLPEGSSVGYPYSISDGGFVAGTTYGSITERGFVWHPSTGMQFIGRLADGKGSAASDVDSFGRVVGSAMNINGRIRAVSWSPTGGLVDLGTLPGTEDSRALCMNDSGLILGYCESIAAGVHKPFWIRPGHAMEEFPQGPEGSLTYANDVNQRGQIVGDGGTVGDVTAVFYEPGIGVLKVKNYVEGSFQGLQLLEAKGINERGDIVGVAILNGRDRAFLAKRLD